MMVEESSVVKEIDDVVIDEEMSSVDVIKSPNLDGDMMIGQAEQYLSEMEDGDLKNALSVIQEIVVRNNRLIKHMENMVDEEDREILQTRAVYTMELRNNMIELARLTAEVHIMPNEVASN